MSRKHVFRKMSSNLAEVLGTDPLRASSSEELQEKIEEAQNGQMIVFEEEDKE